MGHIASELVQVREGVKFEQIRYRGSPQLVTDLISGNIDIGLDTTAAYAPLVQEGKVKALAIAGSRRWSKLPDVPLAKEAGLADFEASVWYAILVPAGTPPAVIAKLNAATNDYVKTAKAKEYLETLGVETTGGTPAEAKAFIAAEIEKWSPIVKGANISF
jgi:tripartite-type tricarboxylate transporter receptor subunit TctC